MKTRMVMFLVVSGFFILLWNIREFAHAGGDHLHHAEPKKGELRQGIKNIILLETPKELEARKPATLVYRIKDSDGRPARNLISSHERMVHMMIISEDFDVFSHIHPEDFGEITSKMLEEGRFPLTYTFPKAGRYLIATNFSSEDQDFSKEFIIEVDGKIKMEAAEDDFSRERNIENYRIALSYSPNVITAGKEVRFNFHIERDGKPVAHLEPYLSAPMHIAVVSSDLKNFIHTHGEWPMIGPEDKIQRTVTNHFGPNVKTHIIFPKKGRYQLFGEFKHDGKVIVSKFMVAVN
jgi:hypothetical protein